MGVAVGSAGSATRKRWPSGLAGVEGGAGGVDGDGLHRSALREEQFLAVASPLWGKRGTLAVGGGDLPCGTGGRKRLDREAGVVISP